MLDGVDAREDRCACAIGAVGMCSRRAASPMCFLDTSAELVIGELLCANLDPLGHDSAGGDELDAVGACLELLADGLTYLVGAVGLPANPSGVTTGHTHRQVGSHDAGAFDQALGTVASSGIGALMVMDSAMFNTHRQRILEFARTQRLPTVCGVRPYAEAGCLIAYAPDILEMWRRAAIFVDKLLKGATPADLPLERPQKLELVLNRTTAEALGVTLPPTLLIQADEVVQ